MEPLEMQYNEVKDGVQVIASEVSVIATLQAIIDRSNEHTEKLNELSEIASNPLYTVPDDFKWGGKIEPGSIRKLVPNKRFKAEDIYAMTDRDGAGVIVFKTRADAQAALELLLNL